MIRRDNSAGWIMIYQTDHSVLSGEIMRHWGNEEFQKPQPLEEVLFAITEHDNGWAEWEKTPKINQNNKYPKNFMEMDYIEQSEIWKRCYLRYSKNHSYASCLIALHFDKFNNKICERNKKAEPLKSDINKFLVQNLNMSLNEIKGNSDILRNLKYLQIGDIISLALCHGWKTVKLDDVPGGSECDRMVVTIESTDASKYYVQPFPFDSDCLELSISGRFIRKKTYSSSRDLINHINESSQTRLNFTILNPN